MPFLSPRRRFALLAFAAAIGALCFFGAQTEMGKVWIANHYAARGESLLQMGGKEAARVSAVKALQVDPKCVRAFRVLLEATENATVDNLLLIRCRIADLQPVDLENKHQLAFLAIYAGRFDIANQSITDLEQAKFDPAKLFDLTARLAAAEGNFQEAEAQAQLLLQMEPTNPAGRLILALSLIHGGNSAQWPEAEKRLQGLLDVPELRPEALRGLRHLAMLRGDFEQAQGYSQQVVAGGRVRFDDWLNHAGICLKLHPENLTQILAELTSHAEEDPDSLVMVAAWLRKNGYGDRIEAWEKTCKSLQFNPAIAQLIRAENLLDQRAWPELTTSLAPFEWPVNDSYRLVLLARALREQNLAYKDGWKKATDAALTSPEFARQLCNVIASWPGWEPELEEFLWDAEKNSPSNLRWSLAALNDFYLKRKNTKGLLQVAEEYYRIYPSSVAVQNNLAFYSLLQNIYLARAFRITTDLYVADSKSPQIVSTQSLAMIRKGDFKSALRILSKLPPETLSQDAVAPYYAAALAGSGRTAEAIQVREKIDQTQLLPEEKELLRF